jgi:hypothetical protein
VSVGRARQDQDRAVQLSDRLDRAQLVDTDAEERLEL